MKYPDDFNTPAFPAGKFVAVSRFMGTWIMVVFVVVIFLCCVMWWVKKNQNLNPFLISTGNDGEPWVLVSHDNHQTDVPAYYVLQESLLDKFVRNWFTITGDVDSDKARWEKCDKDSDACTTNTDSSVEKCAIYCSCNNAVFDDFEKVVLPIYSRIANDGTVSWFVQNLSIKPVDAARYITSNGGLWRLDIVVNTGDEFMTFIGYAKISLDKLQYPKTMGYYVSEFNTYRVN